MLIDVHLQLTQPKQETSTRKHDKCRTIIGSRVSENHSVFCFGSCQFFWLDNYLRPSRASDYLKLKSVDQKTSKTILLLTKIREIKDLATMNILSSVKDEGKFPAANREETFFTTHWRRFEA